MIKNDQRSTKKKSKVVSHKKILLAVIALDIIVICIALIAKNPLIHFSEAGFVTCFSFFQLLIIASLSREIFIIRKGQAKTNAWKMPYAIWLIMAVAFVFLSIDELGMIHEYVDIFIHKIFSIEETALTDRIDDMLVALYGLVGIMGLYYYREELKKYREATVLFITGFIFFFAMISLDLLFNTDDILRLFFSNVSTLHNLDYWLDIIEDIIKIIAEGIFIVAFYRCYEITLIRTETKISH